MDYIFFKAPQGISENYPQYKLLPEDLQNGIIVRSPNWLGDAIMALPAMYCLKNLLPEHGNFFVISPDNFVPFFKSIPWITQTISVGNGHSPWNAYQIKMIKKLNIGVGFLFLNSFKSAYYLKRCNVRKVFGASNGLRNLLLTKSYRVTWHTKEKYATKHQAYKYLDMAYALGAPNWNGEFSETKLLNETKITNKKLLEIRNTENIMAIQPGAEYGPAKRWEPDYYRQVCNYWIKERGGKIVIVGVEKDQEIANKIKNQIDPKKVIDLTGKTTLAELMYVLKKCQLCISNDSGIMHLASALGINGIAIFGSTDPYATGPLGKKWMVLLEKQNCSPCFSRQCINPQKDYKCLKAITPEHVLAAINAIVSRESWFESRSSGTENFNNKYNFRRR